MGQAACGRYLTVGHDKRNHVACHCRFQRDTLRNDAWLFEGARMVSNRASRSYSSALDVSQVGHYTSLAKTIMI